MSCSCNETAFNKLRECWSRHHRSNMQEERECCCSSPKPKVKGKFGIAYIIDTPTRKCKPCGWEVEFNDTPSEVENNCKKMMNWVTCPPLGACQNNQTNMCCCSKGAKQILCSMQQNCCQSTNNDDLCRCCKQKKKICGCSNCCKKSPCCSDKPVNKNQCCCRANNNKNQCCVKTKPKCCCGSMDESKECTKCCCLILEKDNICCCKKSKKKPNCCCRDSDSQSSIDSCECEKPANTKNGRKCFCDCNCARCKCSGKTKKGNRKNQKREKGLQKEADDLKDNGDNVSKPSKNLQGPEPKEERHKVTEATPYTISTHEVPKKEPDKNRDQLLQDFHEELTQKIEEIKKPEEKEQAVQKPVEDLEVNYYLVDSKPDFDIATTTLEKDTLPPSEPLIISNHLIETNEAVPEVQTEENDTEFTDDNLETNPSLNDEITEETEEQIIVTENPPRKLYNKSKLLEEIRRKHKQEMEAIHPKQKVKPVEENLQPTIVASPGEPKPRKKISHLLKRIRQERRKEMEAIHPEHPKLAELVEILLENNDENETKSEENTEVEKDPIAMDVSPHNFTLLEKIREQHRKEMEAIHPQQALTASA